MCAMKSVVRADAARNRERVVVAARELFAESPREVSMDAVARRAGVGRATLYRNFADIHVLSEAIYEEHIVAVERLAREAVDEPGVFERVLLEIIDEVLRCRALVPALADPARSAQVRRLVARSQRALGRVLRQARARGEVRDDLSAGDLMQVISMVLHLVAAYPRAPGLRTRTRRALRLVLDGIRPRSK